MKAMLTTAHGGPDVLQLRHDYPTPTPAPGEVRVRVAATAVNFHDIFTRRGMPGVRIKLPVIVGSDIAGTVESLGQGVDAGWLGKRVLIDPVLRAGDRRAGARVVLAEHPRRAHRRVGAAHAGPARRVAHVRGGVRAVRRGHAGRADVSAHAGHALLRVLRSTRFLVSSSSGGSVRVTLGPPPRRSFPRAAAAPR